MREQREQHQQPTVALRPYRLFPAFVAETVYSYEKSVKTPHCE